MGYCLNVMRGCLASLAEIDVHWREFVRSLEGLSARMQESQDLEQVLLGVHGLIHDAVGYAQKNGPRLSAQVSKLVLSPASVEVLVTLTLVLSHQLKKDNHLCTRHKLCDVPEVNTANNKM